MFADLPLDRRLHLGLESMELTQPTEVQQAVIPVALEGGDLMISAETGSGKTLAYLIPIVETLLGESSNPGNGPLALILVPTRELARQVLKQCRKLTIKAPVDVQGISGGADFISYIVAGLIIGLLLDWALGTGPVMTLFWTIAGVAVGFWRMWQRSAGLEEEGRKRSHGV